MVLIAEIVCIFTPTTVESGDVDIYDYVPSTATFPETKNPTTTPCQAHRSLQTCSLSKGSRIIRRQSFGLATMKLE